MPEEPFDGKGRTDGVRVGVYRDEDRILGSEEGIKFIKLGFPAFSFECMNLLNEFSLFHDLKI